MSGIISTNKKSIASFYLPGPKGDDAYVVAVSQGFEGTKAQWLASLHGADSFVPGPAGYTPRKGVDYFDGAALTGSSALAFIRAADLMFNAAAFANAAGAKAVEYIDGDIVIPPGTCWVPTWTAQGTTLLNSYSITWEEIPV